MQKIKLTQGQFAIVDDRDYCYLSQWKWYADYDKNTGGYYAKAFINNNGIKKIVRMHRLILGAIEGLVVDHKDHDTLNNTRDNICIKTVGENNKNKRMSVKNKSGFSGVCFRKDMNKWVAQIAVKGEVLYLGAFLNIEDAIQARKEANIKYGYIENDGLAFKEKIKKGDRLKTEGLNINNHSGVKGVYFSNYKNKWMAEITINKKRIYLGGFDEKVLAIKARSEANDKFRRIEWQK